jgi:glycosyltransferase involved in cell wall biosynthesis
MSQPLKVLLVNSYDIGGAAIACIRLHIALLKAGVKSKILTLHRSNFKTPAMEVFAPEDDMMSKLKQKFIRRKNHQLQTSLKLPEHVSLSGKFSMPVADFDITQSHWFEWADIVNLHWVNELVDIAEFLPRAGNKPLVWTMHDMHGFTGGCHYSLGCEGYKAACEHCPMLATSNQPNLAHAFWKEKHKALKNISPNLSIVTPSRWLSDVSKSSSLFARFPHFPISNGINTQQFRHLDQASCRKKLQLPEDTYLLLGVGQHLGDERKGFAHLMNCLPLLAHHQNICLVLVGSQPNQVEEKYPIPVIHAGTFKDEQSLAELYNAADLLVAPSIEDNLPNVVVEALCCGLPTVGFAVGGMTQLVQPGENGFLDNSIGSESLARLISKAIETRFTLTHRQTIAAKAAENYSQAVQAANYIALFEEILARQSV